MTENEIMQRMMIFIDETDNYQGANLGGALIEKLRAEGIAGASLLKGSAGFGSHGKVHTTAILDLAVSLPVIIMAIDSETKIQAVLPKLEEMLGQGLIVVDPVSARKVSNSKKETEKKAAEIKAQRETGSQKLQEEAELHKVSEYMDKYPITLMPQQTVAEISALMINNSRSLLPVVNDQGILVGVVMSEDLLTRMLNVHPGGFHFFGLRGNDQRALGQDIKNQTASQVMRVSPPVVQEDTSMFKAAQLMLKEKIKAVPVVHEQKLVGILRMPDVLKIALEIETV